VSKNPRLLWLQTSSDLRFPWSNTAIYVNASRRVFEKIYYYDIIFESQLSFYRYMYRVKAGITTIFAAIWLLFYAPNFTLKQHNSELTE